LLRETMELMPRPLRLEVEGYARWARENAIAIFRALEPPRVPTHGQINEFVLLAGLQRLWSSVNWQVATLERVFQQLTGSDVRGIDVATEEFTPRSREFLELRNMRRELYQILESAGMAGVARTRTLTQLAQLIVGEERGLG